MFTPNSAILLDQDSILETVLMRARLGTPFCRRKNPALVVTKHIVLDKFRTPTIGAALDKEKLSFQVLARDHLTRHVAADRNAAIDA